MSFESPLRPRRDEDFELIETFRIDAGGPVRLDLHLSRMEESAVALGFPFDRADASALVHGIAGPELPLRARITLDRQGQISVSSEPCQPLPSSAVWRLKFARTRLDSNDALLRHKTTRRQIYDRARAECSRNDADEVLLLNEKDEVCEGTITTLFLQASDGSMRTPSLQCGLLRGVLRQEMLAKGLASEAVLGLDHLQGARRIFVGNSLRGLIEAQIV